MGRNVHRVLHNCAIHECFHLPLSRLTLEDSCASGGFDYDRTTVDQFDNWFDMLENRTEPQWRGGTATVEPSNPGIWAVNGKLCNSKGDSTCKQPGSEPVLPSGHSKNSSLQDFLQKSRENTPQSANYEQFTSSPASRKRRLENDSRLPGDAQGANSLSWRRKVKATIQCHGNFNAKTNLTPGQLQKQFFDLSNSNESQINELPQSKSKSRKRNIGLNSRVLHQTNEIRVKNDIPSTVTSFKVINPSNQQQQQIYGQRNRCRQNRTRGNRGNVLGTFGELQPNESQRELPGHTAPYSDTTSWNSGRTAAAHPCYQNYADICDESDDDNTNQELQQQLDAEVAQALHMSELDSTDDTFRQLLGLDDSFQNDAAYRSQLKSDAELAEEIQLQELMAFSQFTPERSAQRLVGLRPPPSSGQSSIPRGIPCPHAHRLIRGSRINDTIQRLFQSRRAQSPEYGDDSCPGDWYAPEDLDLDDYEAVLALTDMVGDVKDSGSTRSRIGLLPSFTIQSKHLANDAFDECKICLDDFEVGSLASSLPCAHVFHERCISRWLKDKASCPLCRIIV